MVRTTVVVRARQRAAIVRCRDGVYLNNWVAHTKRSSGDGSMAVSKTLLSRAAILGNGKAKGLRARITLRHQRNQSHPAKPVRLLAMCLLGFNQYAEISC